MTIAWFCFFDAPSDSARLSSGDRDGLLALLGSCEGIRRGYLYLPAHAFDPYSDDGHGPALALELHFDDVRSCELVLRQDGPLAVLANGTVIPGLGPATVRQQGTLARHYPVPTPLLATALQPFCTFLVDYPGPASDERVWQQHYAAYHPPIMATFPGIRAVAIYTPAVLISGLPFAPAPAMQRNKVVFDSPAALDAALSSPVRETMRRDFEKFPPFDGGNQHFAMHTWAFGAPL
ncbi:MAG: hypothetical protein ACI8PT_000034 [Gammaproteobacteria bacterium]